MKKINIVIPMAGAGKRFKDAGYRDPKPFIDVFSKPMIQWVIENLNSMNRQINFIFVCNKEHLDQYNFEKLLYVLSTEYSFEYKILSIDYLTEGALCTCLQARNIIDSEDELLIANSDQYLDMTFYDFIKIIDNYKNDGAIISFISNNPKWSFVKVNDEGYVTQVKEKEVISDIATCGIYYFKKGSEFIKAADDIIHKNIRVNNEFYVAPVYNELIHGMNKKILNYMIPVQVMWGLGIPEDLKKFIIYWEDKRD
jgi:NDP-sugar pyrophosphorylase family protein